MEDEDRNDPNRASWRRRQERRRQRLRGEFENSRRRHEPPPDPEEWEPKPWWKHSWEVLWDNPTGLLVLAIALAILLYILIGSMSVMGF